MSGSLGALSFGEPYPAEDDGNCSGAVVHGDGLVETKVDALESFDFLSDEYRELFAHANATAFQSPSWLSRLYAGLAPVADGKPLIVTVRAAASGRLIAVLPLLARRHFGLRIAEFADLGVCDYAAAVVDPAFREVLAAPAVAARIRKALGGCDLVVARKVPQQALRTFAMLGEFRHSPLPVHAQFIDPGGSQEAWRQRTFGNCRGPRLDRKRRRLAHKGRLQTRVLRDPAEVAGVIDHIRSFRHDRFQERGIDDLLSDPVYAGFYRGVAGEVPPSRGYVMCLDDRVLAAAFGIAAEKVFHLLLIGFDPTRFHNESLGLLLIEDIVLDGLARGERGVDLTIGDQEYKAEFGTQKSDVLTVLAGVGLLGRMVASLLMRSAWLRRAACVLSSGRGRVRRGRDRVGSSSAAATPGAAM